KETDLNVSYENVKKGRRIVGFQFLVAEKKVDKKEVEKESTGDNSIDGLTDKQLGRIARNQQFIADYNHLVSSTSPAGQNTQAWEFEMINRLKKDLKQFNKRPIRDYLDG